MSGKSFLSVKVLMSGALVLLIFVSGAMFIQFYIIHH